MSTWWYATFIKEAEGSEFSSVDAENVTNMVV